MSVPCDCKSLTPVVINHLITTQKTTSEKETDNFIDSAFKRGWITEREKEFLCIKHPICQAFYVLPKIHKSLQNTPLRPIEASTGSLMEPLSQFVDHFIRKYVTTFLGDTTDVLNIIDIRCNDYELLKTFDVQSS